MSTEKRIEYLKVLSDSLDSDKEPFRSIILSAYHNNRWFTKENIIFSADSIRKNYLNEEKCRQWLSAYNLRSDNRKTIGLILSGNIPMVGFHDLICIYLSGHMADIKLSSKDTILMKYLIHSLHEIDPDAHEQLKIVDKLSSLDAVIATGSNNSARYFNAYFGKYPHIIRKNRNSVAVLTGAETHEDIINLGLDMFSYFGLGCRNVTKIYAPDGYDWVTFIDLLQEHVDIIHHSKFKNNFDYQYSIHLLNRIEHYNGNFFLLRENEHILSPITVINYEYYNDLDAMNDKLESLNEEIQCIVSNDISHIPFGKAQSPALSDYADNTDTMAFLTGL